MKKFLLALFLLSQSAFAADPVPITTAQKKLLNDHFSPAVAQITQLGTLIEGGLSSALIQYVDKTLTAAQLDTLNATPVALVAAPGAGKITVVDSIACFVDFVATRAELGSGVIEFRYTDGSGVKVTADLPNTTMELNSDTYYVAQGASGVPVVNAAVVAVASADVTSGDSLLKCRTFYRSLTVSDI